MAILEILKLPDPRLKEMAEEVNRFDEELKAFIADLEETRQAGPAAVGIAAPQVGRGQRIVILDCSTTKKPVENHGHLVLVNPEIIEWEGFELGREGCLSVPDYTGNVIRAERIKVRFQDPQGEHHEFEMVGFEARALQHEVDHLDGILFIDRLVSRRTDLFQRKVYQKGSK
ncbi:MAG: peptide deformylase [Candidatus Thiodiazotropha sp.]|nr:peptide deformylase [Candidatus Thiodiazotropha taylori]MBT3058553.1 peptide deformylase [Candidatus Thiodiazotropha sp. (ex Lucina pensylvanica)]MBT3061828.1 peptide deformylase [Candidatus Thiodiazotropha sp. (ex Lucina pensylvanica)]MBT3064831.1 peptide deformylase [Candidatus Thiodiazotropha sp. (ex Lucina pensylvanica)]PUB75314.1 MAG: peptide deformylase [gamma proteobacterium symbiont of Ctena orbiculata]